MNYIKKTLRVPVFFQNRKIRSNLGLGKMYNGHNFVLSVFLFQGKIHTVILKKDQCMFIKTVRLLQSQEYCGQICKKAAIRAIRSDPRKTNKKSKTFLPFHGCCFRKSPESLFTKYQKARTHPESRISFGASFVNLIEKNLGLGSWWFFGPQNDFDFLFDLILEQPRIRGHGQLSWTH